MAEERPATRAAGLPRVAQHHVDIHGSHHQSPRIAESGGRLIAERLRSSRTPGPGGGRVDARRITTSIACNYIQGLCECERKIARPAKSPQVAWFQAVVTRRSIVLRAIFAPRSSARRRAGARSRRQAPRAGRWRAHSALRQRLRPNGQPRTGRSRGKRSFQNT